MPSSSSENNNQNTNNKTSSTEDDSHFAEPLMLPRQNTQVYPNSNSNFHHHQQQNNNTNATATTTSELRNRRESFTQLQQNYGNGGVAAATNSNTSTPPSSGAIAGSSMFPSSATNHHNLHLDQQQQQNQQLPDLSDCVFATEKVNAHTLMNKWVTVDETRNFALLKKERKALVTFQCRIIVKGAKHIQFQIACGPSVEFLMPTWILVRYIQSELLPPCIFDEYRLVETWMKTFVEEMKALSEKATALLNHQHHQQQQQRQNSSSSKNSSDLEVQYHHHSAAQMTRHVIHAAASVVNATDLFLGLITAAKESAAHGGVAGEAGIGLMHFSGGLAFHRSSQLDRYNGFDEIHHDDDDDDFNDSGSPSTTTTLSNQEDNRPVLQDSRSSTPPLNASKGSAGEPSSATTKRGVFGNLKHYIASRVSRSNNENNEHGERSNSPSTNNNNNNTSGNNSNNNGGVLTPLELLADPCQLPPEQRALLQQVALITLIPAGLRNAPPNPRTDGIKSSLVWCWNVLVALVTCLRTRKEDIRARFILPRPVTKEEFLARDVLREQVKRNRTHVAMFLSFVFLLICRYVSLDLFLIIAGIVVYYVRYLFTEYKNLFLSVTKRTARSRVNRVKDWFTFSLVRRKTVNNTNNANNVTAGDQLVEDAAAAAAAAAADPTANGPDFELEEWDFF